MIFNKFFCIGDSHISVFLGKDDLALIYPQKTKSLFPYFDVIRIGPITAYNMGSADSSTRAKVKIDFLIKEGIPKNSIIIFSAGEIDIRVHLLKQADLQKKSIQEIASQIVEKYLSVLKEYGNAGYKIIVLSPPPSSFKSEDDPEYPKYGTEQERNIATEIFNNHLAGQSQIYGFGYIDIFNKYIDKNHFTKKRYLWDGIHPSTYVIKDIFIQLNAILKTKLNLPLNWMLRELLRKFKHKTILYF